MTQETFSHWESQLAKWVHHISEGLDPLTQRTEEKAQELYQLASFLYRNQQYPEASYFFRLLVACQPSDAKYWKGFGACLQMQQEYEQALECYMQSQILHCEQPDPYLYVYVADCYFALKQKEAGLKALEAARLSAEEKHDRRILKHVALMCELWSKSYE